jgi:alkylation response protein AidB-like acyl-CoA dehydrogenase
MKIGLTDEQIFLQKSLQELFTKECPPDLVRSLRQDGTDGMPTGLWKALAGAGVFGLPFAGAVGGEDGDLFDLGLVYEEAGRVLCPTLVYSSIAFGIAVDRLGTREQVGAHIRALASGGRTASVALGDPADPRSTTPSVTAVRRGGSWFLSGTLRFLANGDVVDTLLVCARTQPGDGPERLLGFVVAPGGPGWSQRRMRTFGHDVQTHAELDAVEVADPEAMLGDPGLGLNRTDLAATRNALTALQCMEMVGGAAAVLERTVDYLKVRHQFNRPIASFQAAQHHVADLRIALDSARLAAYQAAWWTARGHLAEREVAIAKLHCNIAYKAATLTSHQLHGGMGYLRETDLHLWSERAKVTELLDGTDEVQLARIAGVLGLAS